MQFPDIVSLFFLVACAIYLLYCLLGLSNKTRSAMYWLFLGLCLSMSVWAFSFSAGNVATDYESCLIWRRIGSIGWGTMFSFFIHYILLLTENRMLKKKWIYIILYLPAILNIFLYGIYTNTAVQSYNLVNTSYGWINISGNTALDWYYNIYYVSFSLIGIILLLRWGFKSKDKIKQKEAILISVSYIFAIISGSLTEYIINYFFQAKVPQLASIIILLPLSVMLYFNRRHNFMRMETVSQETEANQILSERTKLKLYFYLAVTYGIAAFAIFGLQFYSRREQISDILPFSSTIFGMGFLLVIIQNLKIKQEYKHLLSNIIIVVSVPVMILKFTSTSAVYAWAVPVIMMLVSIALNQKKMLISIGGATFATLICLWVTTPVMNVKFSPIDHVARIIILVIIMWFVYYINHTYVDIINENREKVMLEKLINQVSNLFLNINETNIDEKMVESIRICGNHFKLENVHLVFLSTEMEPDKSYEWYASETDRINCGCTKEKLEKLISEAYPNKLDPQGSLFIADPKISVEDGSIVKFLESMGMKSMIIKPLSEKNEIIGILCFGSFRRIMKWGEQQQQPVNLLTHMITDMWTKLEAEKKLYYQAKYDALTGLPNRMTFFEHLSRAISMAEQSDKLVGVIFFDIDEFKAVNDSMGHDSGDLLLSYIGNNLLKYCHSEDILARFGGDEFMLMVSEMDTVEDIRCTAEQIIYSIQKPIRVKDHEFRVSCSAGIAVYPYDGSDPDTLIKNADHAMYKSKENGKNQYMFCNEDMKEESRKRSRLTAELYGALERHELQLYYQPQVHAISKKIVGAEALLRWFHPELGIISPGLFIPLAEQTGLILPIGDWVLMTACMQCQTFHLRGLVDIRIAVNVSITQLRNPQFVGRVRQILEETQLEPSYLELEVTESVAVRDSYDIIQVLKNLKKLGVSISIDDFGTEYSSFSRLSTMPIECVKLDMYFARSINRSEKENKIIQGIIDLAHTIGLKVIAEGVETELQLDFLTDSGCDEIQGFFFYRPVPPDELEHILLQETISTNHT